jgi:hypothetical protein
MATQTAYRDFHDHLTQLVHGWTRRLRWQQTARWLPRALMPGLVLGIAVALMARVRPLLLPGQITILTALAMLAGALIALAIIWLRGQPPVTAARRFDVLFELDERVSTALELIAGRIRSNDEFAARLLADAGQHADAVRAREHLPLRVSRRDLALVAALAALLTFILWLPNPQSEAVQQQAAQNTAIEAAAEDLGQITEQVAADSGLDDEARRELLEALQAGRETLQQAEISPEEALAAVSDVQAALEDQAAALGAQLAALEGALQQSAEALRGLEGQGDSGAQSLNQLLEQLASQIESLSPEAQQQAGAALQQAGQAMGAVNPEAGQAMQDAGQALEDGQMEAAQGSLQQAQQGAEQTEQQAGALEGAQEQLEDAAEQAGESAEQISQAGLEQQELPPQGVGQPGEQSAQGMPSESQASDPSQPGQGSEASEAGAAGGEPQDRAGDSGADAENPAESAAGSTSGSGAGDDAGEAGSSTTQGDGAAQSAGGNQPDGAGERAFDPVYAPQRLGGEAGDDTVILEPDTSDAPVVEGEFSQNPTGEVTVPYNQVFADYADAASRALQNNYVPLGLRDIVREYFSSLEP